MGKKQKVEKAAEWPTRLYIERHDDSDGDGPYYSAHTELTGIDHGTEIIEFVPATGEIETIEVVTLYKERD